MALLAMSPLPVNVTNIHKLNFGVVRSVDSCLRMLKEGFSPSGKWSCQSGNMEAGYYHSTVQQCKQPDDWQESCFLPST